MFSPVLALVDVEDAGDVAAVGGGGDLAGVENVEGVVGAVDVVGVVGAVLLVHHDAEDCVGWQHVQGGEDGEVGVGEGVEEDGGPRGGLRGVAAVEVGGGGEMEDVVEGVVLLVNGRGGVASDVVGSLGTVHHLDSPGVDQGSQRWLVLEGSLGIDHFALVAGAAGSTGGMGSQEGSGAPSTAACGEPGWDLLLLCLRVGTPGAPELAFVNNRHELSIYLRVGIVALLLARVDVGGRVDLPRCRVLLISKG